MKPVVSQHVKSLAELIPAGGCWYWNGDKWQWVGSVELSPELRHARVLNGIVNRHLGLMQRVMAEKPTKYQRVFFRHNLSAISQGWENIGMQSTDLQAFDRALGREA